MNKRAKGARRPLTCLSAALLALVSSSAMALGLGDIRVLSKPGQPLLAEIPVISADPSELENLRVALASPVTFERVGLQRPAGLVSELQFELTRNAQGRAVVRVTSQTPVETPSLSFLVEADWGQGRLVREYSALVDAPASALAVAEPEIVAPAGVLSDTIVRDAPAAAAITAEPAPATLAAASAAPRPRAAAPAPAPALAADGSVTVQRGQTLSQIAGSLARGNQISRDRAMIALLRANPEAFIRGNVNLLKEGAVLRMPGDSALTAVDAAEAAALVREHAAQWRQARTVPQPAGAPMPVAKADGSVSSPAAATGARLEIAPALASDAAHAGTTTGTSAGSEGDMLGNEQLRQAKEDIATRDAEIGDLKQRVAELEKLKEQQQSLIAMKDNDLAAAQQRLAQAPGAPGAGTPWYWLGLPLLVLVALGAWLLRRRKPSPLPPLREEHDAAGLAAALPAGAALDTLAEQDAGVGFAAEGGRQEPAMPAWASTAGHDAPDAESREDAAPAEWRAGELDEDELAELPAAVNDLPRWDDAAAPVAPTEPAEVAVPDYALQAEQEPQFRGVFDLPAEPHEHGTAAPVDLHDDRAAVEDAVESPADSGHDWTPRVGQERLELAIAYLDLGDAQTARTLLHEVAEGGDLHCQAQARELLARLP
jgi:pilus assembly protein FimV